MRALRIPLTLAACSARVELACDILKKSRVIQGEAK